MPPPVPQLLLSISRGLFNPDEIKERLQNVEKRLTVSNDQDRAQLIRTKEYYSETLLSGQTQGRESFTQQSVEEIEAGVVTDSTNARAWLDLGILRLHEDTLIEAAEALEKAWLLGIERKASPEDAFEPDLAMSLNNLANSLAEVGAPR